jgi:radical SAM superfamily enzyme YgiQ (UPF0313 family)
MPDILLSTINAKWIHPSLALRLLKANLGVLEGRAEILEFALRQPLEEKLEAVLAARPRILAFSVSIWNHRATAELLEALEGRWGRPPGGEAPGGVPGASPIEGPPGPPGPFVVLGGPEVSALPETGPLFRRAHWVIRGEGELAFRELCAALLGGGGPPDLERVPSARGIRGKFIEARAPELGAIDPGYRLYGPGELRRKLLYVESSRGCPFSCEFCQGRGYPPESGPRNFPLEPFLANLGELLRRGARSFKFLDRNFNLDPGRARRIMEFFLEWLEAPGDVTRETPEEDAPRTGLGGERPPRGRPLSAHFEMIPSRFPGELRETLRRFPPGTLRLELGLQTFRAETAALVRRPSDPPGELELIRFLREETEAILHADLIAGLPGEGLDSFGEGFDRLWLALTTAKSRGQPFEIQPGILKLLPGAPLARHSEEWGMVYSPEPPYEVLESSALDAGTLGRLKNFARFWELIVNRGSFPGLVPALFPPGRPVFRPFLALSDLLLARFGRNWGIAREDLRKALLLEGNGE